MRLRDEGKKGTMAARERPLAASPGAVSYWGGERHESAARGFLRGGCIRWLGRSRGGPSPLKGNVFHRDVEYQLIVKVTVCGHQSQNAAATQAI